MENFIKQLAKNLLKGDKVIWLIYFLLVGWSVLAVFSASSYAIAGTGETFKVISRHLVFLGGSFVVLLFFYQLPQMWIRALATLGLALAIVFLFLLFVAGESHQGAARTIMGIQPSELVKFSLIVVAAMFIDRFQDPQFLDRMFKPFCLIAWLAIGLILPMNLSQAIIIFVPLIAMMAVARIPFRKIAFFIGVPTLLLAVLILVASTVFADSQSGIGKQLGKFRYQTWQARIEKFSGESLIDRWDETTNITEKWQLIRSNDQVVYSKSAIYDGQQFGKGSGNSVWRNRIQEVSKDFIYAVIVEEYGMVGGIVVIMLYLWLLWRGGVLVGRVNVRFRALVILGAVTLIAFQAFVHIGVCTGAIPVTGQTLPLISKGGTSLAVMGAMFGLILGMSRIVDEEEEEQKRRAEEEAEAENLEAAQSEEQTPTAEATETTDIADNQELPKEELQAEEQPTETDEFIEVAEGDTDDEDFDSIFEEYKEQDV